MHKTLKSKAFSYLPLFGLSILTASPSLAAPPMSFDQWHLNGSGQIVAGCPSGFSCYAPTTAQGMYQQTVVTPEGKRFIQTIVHDNDKYQGVMTAETFVSIEPVQNSGNGGISAKQVISADGRLGDFEAAVILNLGWAASEDDPEIIIDSTLFGTGNEKRGRGQGTYYERFYYEGDRDADGNDLGSLMVSRSELGASKDRKKKTAWQVFETRIATGERVKNAGAITTTDEGVPSYWSGRRGPGNVNVNDGYLGSDDPTPVDNWPGVPTTDPNMGPNVGMGASAGPGSGGRPISGGEIANTAPFGSYNYDATGDTEGANLQVAGGYAGTVTWNPGDKVQTVYIGQDLGPGVGAFAFQAFDNLSDSAGHAAIRKLRDPTPTVWTVDPFGARPGMQSDGIDYIDINISGTMADPPVQRGPRR